MIFMITKESNKRIFLIISLAAVVIVIALISATYMSYRNTSRDRAITAANRKLLYAFIILDSAGTSFSILKSIPQEHFKQVVDINNLLNLSLKYGLTAQLALDNYEQEQLDAEVLTGFDKISFLIWK